MAFACSFPGAALGHACIQRGIAGHTQFITSREVKPVPCNKNQVIHCDVTSCQHHSTDGMCRLDSIKVAPRSSCHSGKCDESECASYHAK